MNVSPAQIEAAMDEWLSTPSLTAPESIMIRTLKEALKKGVDEFRLCAKHISDLMPNTVQPAIEKARTQGLCQEWPSA
ncbi:hypothetical protein [Aureimonas frigidaquae]|uniref:hypothetical protein n=1 Tax=Aureimonas frigidaquae TaxID=424757 RepID=UPI000785640D|nr:hypothetical protein [Aureimonas frigidaquae]